MALGSTAVHSISEMISLAWFYQGFHQIRVSVFIGFDVGLCHTVEYRERILQTILLDEQCNHGIVRNDGFDNGPVVVVFRIPKSIKNTHGWSHTVRTPGFGGRRQDGIVTPHVQTSPGPIRISQNHRWPRMHRPPWRPEFSGRIGNRLARRHPATTGWTCLGQVSLIAVSLWPSFGGFGERKRVVTPIRHRSNPRRLRRFRSIVEAIDKRCRRSWSWPGFPNPGESTSWRWLLTIDWQLRRRRCPRRWNIW